MRLLVDHGFEVIVVPANTSSSEILDLKPDGIFLSNGPGDPEPVTYAVATVKELMEKKPILGICLGHQIMGLAVGARTYKLKYGHHGGNHPALAFYINAEPGTSEDAQFFRQQVGELNKA